jgi:NAD+ kinase
MAFRRIGVAVKPKKAEAGAVVRDVRAWLLERGYEVLLDPEAAALCQGGPGLSRAEIVAAADLIIVLGGDGTLLSIARLTGPREVPILGVNLGGLGFLTEVTLPGVFETLERVLREQYSISRRLMLAIEAHRGGERLGTYHALNDVVFTKTAPSRIVELEMHVNGEYVTRYRADGLIVASPTGSTAYCLSAGGPILYPTLPALVVIPICPHTLTNRPLVLPDTACIDVIPQSTVDGIHLTVDGQVDVPLQAQDRVVVRRAEHSLALVKSPTLNYFELLRTKFRWGER